MLAGALAGYGGRAYAQQVCTGPDVDIVCDGASTETQDLTDLINAQITTVAGFEVKTTSGNGITISGDGELFYTDENESPLFAPYIALYVNNSGDYGGSPGGVIVTTNGYLKGNTGVYVYNQASGGTSITTYNKVYGNYYGIHAKNYSGTLSITSSGPVTGGDYGINLKQDGGGIFEVTADGNVTGSDDVGIFALNNAGVSLSISTGAGTTVYGGTYGIQAINLSSDAAMTISANGDVQGGGNYGIYAVNEGTDLTIKTGAASTVRGEYAIKAQNSGSGSTTLDLKGNAYGSGDNNYAISVSSSGTDLTVTTHAGSIVKGDGGIAATNYGSGILKMSIGGDVTTTTPYGHYGITTSNSGTKTDITVNGSIYGNDGGINAYQGASGSIKIQANGYVGGVGTAIYTGFGLGLDGTSVEITTAAGSTVKGASGIVVGGNPPNSPKNGITVIADGTVIGNGGSGGGWGIYARNQADHAIEIFTGAQSSIQSTYGGGIGASNYGTVKIQALGSVTSEFAPAISAYNNGSSTKITTGAGDISGVSGIVAKNNGGGDITIRTGGTISGGTGPGIEATASGGNGDINITTSANSAIYAVGGISAQAEGSGSIHITAGAAVTTPSGSAVSAQTDSGSIHITAHAAVTTFDFPLAPGIKATSSGGSISVHTGAQSVVSGAEGSYAIEAAGGRTKMTVAGTLNAGIGSAQFDQANPFDNEFELHPTAVINGKVVAGPGDNDKLAFGGSGAGTFDLNNIDLGDGIRQYQNFETFEVKSGAWDFTGGTSAPFAVTGGTVMGTGTFGNLSLLGGTLAPGNSIGTMHVNGGFALSSGAVYEVEVNAEGRSDKVIVKGTVNLTGATLRVLAESGDYKPSTDYTIIDNDGNDAVTGKFAKIEHELAFLKPSVVYDGGDGNDVVLTLVRHHGSHNGGGPSFCSVANTQNQCNVAKALDQFPTSNPLFLDVLFQTAEGARQAFDALSGEIHASVAGMLARDSRYVREAILGRLTQARYANDAEGLAALGAGGPQVASLDGSAMALGYANGTPETTRSPLAFWTHAYGAWGDFASDGNAAEATRDLGGFVSGMDAHVGGSWRAGLATGASFSNVDVDARASSADVETYQLGGYIGGLAGRFALRGGGMWAWNDIDTSRAVLFPGFYERQTARYDADTGQLFGEVAYPTQMFGMALEPFGGIACVSVDRKNFSEHGGPQAGLQVGDLEQEVGYSTVGLRAAQTLMWGGMELTPHVWAAWQHAFGDVTPAAARSFATTGIGFTIYGVPLAEDSALIDAGLDLTLGPRTTAGVSYSGQFGAGVSDNGVKGRFTWLF